MNTPISEALIRAMMPLAGARLTPHPPYIAAALEWGRISALAGLAAFFAHLTYESSEYRFVREIADGSAPKLDLAARHQVDASPSLPLMKSSTA